MDIRRVVTGHDAAGKAIVVDDQMVAPVTSTLAPGTEFHRMWGADSIRRFPDDGSMPDAPKYFPPKSGFRFGFFTIPPVGDGGLPEGFDLEAALEEFERKLPGMMEHGDPAEPGMHTTASIDYGVVISGQATLELDDGVKVVLKTGDSYIQNGTRHRWSNAGNVPAVLAISLIGAEHQNAG